MNSKQFTLLFLLVSLGLILFAANLLKRGTTDTVYQAVEHYEASGHADRESISFTNWNQNDPPLIPVACARCHSTEGLLDYLGEDGSNPGMVDQAAPTGGVITCGACHNSTAHTLEVVAFHSGEVITPAGSEATCLVCHQSRQSTDGIQNVLNGLEEDVVSPELTFINPHYNFSGSTQFGSVTRSGYEYPGQQYYGYFAHAAGVETCVDCHNPHSGSLEPKQCAACHSNVVNKDDFKLIRSQGIDFDGNLDTTEGIYEEIQSLHGKLLEGIYGYARSVAGKAIVYGDRFPYFFMDTNNDGIADPEEINPGNRYDAWTPRLVKAAYNYQFAKKDPGGYVHNPRYVLQLLHDSVIDLLAASTASGVPGERILRP